MTTMTITLTPEQAAARQRGERITIDPPRPLRTWTACLVPDSESSRMRWHSRDLRAEDAESAARQWMTRRGPGSQFIGESIPGTVIVAPQDPEAAPGGPLDDYVVDPEARPYGGTFTRLQFFRVDEQRRVTRGIR